MNERVRLWEFLRKYGSKEEGKGGERKGIVYKSCRERQGRLRKVGND